MGQLVNLLSELKLLKFFVGVVKTNFKKVTKFNKLDPKPSDLTINRLKIF